MKDSFPEHIENPFTVLLLQHFNSILNFNLTLRLDSANDSVIHDSSFKSASLLFSRQDEDA